MRHAATLALACALPATLACTKTSGGTAPREPAGAPARRAVLANLGANVVLPTLEAFAEEAAALGAATAAHAAAPSDTTLAAARATWATAMATWQRAELMQFGPAGVMGDTAGGKDLRDAIYAWPFMRPCSIDQATVAEAYGADLDAANVSVRTLAAIEYLLFAPDAENACAANVDINSSGDWAALGDAEVRARRAAYAARAAALVRTAANDLRTAWRADGGNFLAELARAGEGGMVYGTSQDALNAVSDAMFYLEKETKDMKVAVPLGISGCASDTCPADEESPHAHHSLAHIRENISAFERLYLGGEPGGAEQGFDDLLRDAGATALAEKLSEDLAAARTAAAAVSDPLPDALTADRAKLDALYDALATLAADLKTEFVSVLDLDLPQRVEADND